MSSTSKRTHSESHDGVHTPTNVEPPAQRPRGGWVDMDDSDAAPLLAAPPTLSRVGHKVPFIVVLEHEYAIEIVRNAQLGYMRGLGNTFTLEVVAADALQAKFVVENWLKIEFDSTATIRVVHVGRVPGLAYSDAEGNTVSVLSSRFSSLRQGASAEAELVNALQDEQNTKLKPMLEIEVEKALAEAERAGCVSR